MFHTADYFDKKKKMGSALEMNKGDPNNLLKKMEKADLKQNNFVARDSSLE